MKYSNRRPIIVIAICGFCTLAFVMLWSRGFLPLQQLEFIAHDLQMRLGRKTPVDERLALIGIDKPIYEADFSDEELQREPVLRKMQTDYPWSRAVWARLIEKLAGAGAKVIVIDVVFAKQGEGDDQLHQALEKYKDRVVIGYDINTGKTESGDFSQLLLPAETVISPSGTNSPVGDDRLGYVNIWPDLDDTLRSSSFRLTGAQVGNIVPEGVVMESLDARTLRKFGRADAIPAGFGSRLFRYTAPASMVYKSCPIGDVLSPKLWEKSYANGGFFKDKIVIVGPTAEIFHDEHNTPFVLPKKMGGPEIHLQVLAAALQGEFPRELSILPSLFILGMSGTLAAALCFLVRQPAKRLFCVVGLSGGYAVFTQLLFDHAGWVVPLAVPLLSLVSGSMIVLTYDFVLERLERMKLRNTMGLYFSPRVLEIVLANPGSMEPRRAEITMLLSDLRNSTPLAEVLSPQGMFDLLNRVFEVQTKAVMDEEATLEHFLGDQFLSYWGAPQPQPDGADRAQRAAITLITAMEAIRPTLAPEVAKLFGYGVALHSGAVLIGNKGSAQRLDYGIVGDAVNEAARVEALTKYYGSKLLVTGATFGKFTTQPVHRLLDRIIVKGKTEPVVVYECVNPCTPPEYEEICRRYEMAFDEYTAGCFEEARIQFESLVREFSDHPSKALSARCARLLADPPVEWHGFWKMDNK